MQADESTVSAGVWRTQVSNDLSAVGSSSFVVTFCLM